MNGPNRTLGYHLLDSGYDLWIGNARGNKYSYKTHINAEILEKEYWDFSWQEIARYDLVACYKFVLAKTRKERIYVIGYSIGGTEVVAAMADPEISDWIQQRTAKVL